MSAHEVMSTEQPRMLPLPAEPVHRYTTSIYVVLDTHTAVAKVVRMTATYFKDPTPYDEVYDGVLGAPFAAEWLVTGPLGSYRYEDWPMALERNEYATEQDAYMALRAALQRTHTRLQHRLQETQEKLTQVETHIKQWEQTS